MLTLTTWLGRLRDKMALVIRWRGRNGQIGYSLPQTKNNQDRWPNTTSCPRSLGVNWVIGQEGEIKCCTGQTPIGIRLRKVWLIVLYRTYWINPERKGPSVLARLQKHLPVKESMNDAKDVAAVCVTSVYIFIVTCHVHNKWVSDRISMWGYSRVHSLFYAHRSAGI